MAPRGSRAGAFSRRQAELQREIAGRTEQEREAAAELGRLGLVAPRSLFLERKVAEELEAAEERDEAGFFPEEQPLVYVTPAEAARDDGEECDVVYKRIALRKGPSAEARVLGAACEGERLYLFEWDETRTWRKLHFRLCGGWGGCVHAWVMMRHPQLGTLVRAPGESIVRGPQEQPLACACGSTFAAEALFCSRCGSKRPEAGEQVEEAPPARPQQSWLGVENPRGIKPGSQRQAGGVAEGNVLLLTAAELRHLVGQGDDDEDVDELLAGSGEGCRRVPGREVLSWLQKGPEPFEVAYRPFIAVRSQPSTDGAIKGTAMFRQRLDTFGLDGTATWRRVFGKVSGSGRIVEAWVLVEKEGVGPLIQAVPELVLPEEAGELEVMG